MGRLLSQTKCLISSSSKKQNCTNYETQKQQKTTFIIGRTVFKTIIQMISNTVTRQLIERQLIERQLVERHLIKTTLDQNDT